MSDEPYLLRLGTRLTSGLASMDERRKERHRSFILSQQMPDGGFRGREGDSDLYYTGFAVRSLMILGGLAPSECESVTRYVKSCQQDRLSVIDLVSWLYTGLAVQLSGGGDPFADAVSDWMDRVAETLESVRTEDGGYAKSTEGAAGSTYHSFLVALTYELLGRSVPRTNALIQFLYDRQRDDGGFVEIAPMKRSGTNPTAAAAALLKIFDAMDDELREDIRGFLSEVKSAEGGFQANTRIPFADGLSTFTALLTIQDLDLEPLIPPAKIEAFITDWLEFPTGGFRGASWDEQADVEYTFYGLGTLALLGGM
ncbi:MAG: terpene cyclase/mutase family protein [Planctomycetaceae bacterium]